MDAWLVVGGVALSVVLDVMTWKSGGFIFALIGGISSLYLQGSLAANQAITIGNQTSGTCGASTSCGYALSAGDVQFVIALISVFTIASFMLVYVSARDKYGGGRV